MMPCHECPHHSAECESCEDRTDSINAPLSPRIRWRMLFDARSAELLNSAMLLTWGFWLLAAWDSFSVCPREYLVLESIGPEWAWGAASVGLAGAKFVALWRDDAAARKWLALACGTFWLVVALSVGVANYRATRLPVFAVLALNMFRVFFCIRLYKK